MEQVQPPPHPPPTHLYHETIKYGTTLKRPWNDFSCIISNITLDTFIKIKPIKLEGYCMITKTVSNHVSLYLLMRSKQHC